MPPPPTLVIDFWYTDGRSSHFEVPMTWDEKAYYRGGEMYPGWIATENTIRGRLPVLVVECINSDLYEGGQQGGDHGSSTDLFEDEGVERFVWCIDGYRTTEDEE